MTWLEGQFAELLLVSLDELSERHSKAFGVDIAHDNAIGDFEEELSLPGGLTLGIGVGHIEAEIDDDFFRGRVNPVGVGVDGPEFSFIQEDLDLLLSGLPLWLFLLLILYFFRHS